MIVKVFFFSGATFFLIFRTGFFLIFRTGFFLIFRTVFFYFFCAPASREIPDASRLVRSQRSPRAGLTICSKQSQSDNARFYSEHFFFSVLHTHLEPMTVTAGFTVEMCDK